MEDRKRQSNRHTLGMAVPGTSAGEAACNRLASAQGIKEQGDISVRTEDMSFLGNRRSMDDELDAILSAAIPAPGSSSESKHLKRLRELDHASKGPGNVRSPRSSGAPASGPSYLGDSSGSLSTYEIGSDGAAVETELYWHESRLIWSRSGVVYRTFLYDEPIHGATWAWLDSEPANNDIASVLSNAQDHAQGGKRVRALCIALSSHLAIYEPHSGREFAKKLDFDVLSIVALDIGILVQRRPEREDQEYIRKRPRSSLGIHSSRQSSALPSLFLLRRPLDELQPLQVVDRILFPSSPSKGTSTPAVTFNDAQGVKHFNFTSRRVVSAVTLPWTQTPRGVILLMADNSSGKLYLYNLVQSSCGMTRAAAVRDESETRLRPHMGSATPIRPLPVRKSSNTYIPTTQGRSRVSSSSRARLSSAGHDRNRVPSSVQRNVSTGYQAGLFASSAGVANVEEEEGTEFEHASAKQMLQLIDDLDVINEDRVEAGPRGAKVLRDNTAPRRSARISSVPLGAGTSYAATATANLMRTPYTKGQLGPDELGFGRSRRQASMGNPGESRSTPAAFKSTRHNNPPSEASNGIHVEPLGNRVSNQYEAYRTKSSNADGRTNGKFESETPLMDIESAAGAETIDAALSLISEIEIEGMTSSVGSSAVQANLVCDLERMLLFVFLKDAQRLYVVEVSDKAIAKMACLDARLVPLCEGKTSLKAAAVKFAAHRSVRNDLILHESEGKDACRLLLSPYSESTYEDSILLDSSSAVLWPASPLIRKLLRTALDGGGDDLGKKLYSAWILSMQQSQGSDEWAALKNVIFVGADTEEASDEDCPFQSLRGSNAHTRLSRCFGKPVEELRGLRQTGIVAKASASTISPTWTPQELRSLTRTFHSCAQDSLLDNIGITQELPRLIPCIVRLSHELGWSMHVTYWSAATRALYESSCDLSLAQLGTRAASDEPRVFNVVAAIEGAINGRMNAPVDNFVTGRVAKLLSALKNITISSKEATAAFDSLLRYGLVKRHIARFPLLVAQPLLEMKQRLRSDPPLSWSKSAYDFIGRPDLAVQRISGGQVATGWDTWEAVPADDAADKQTTVVKPLHPMCASLFGQDSRLSDVVQMLQTKNPVATRGPADSTATGDEDVVAEMQKRFFLSITERIKATSIGRGMLLMGTEPFKPMEQIDIAPLNLRIRMLCNCIVQHREPDPDSQDMEWPEFHNGVAAALQLDASNTQIESTWIFNQTSDEFTPRKAGYIYGLGLRGYLRHLGKVHAHYYLSQRHPMTTMGLLLGISVSFLGSCDPMAKALMSIHLLHTLPNYSKPLKTSIVEQSAALLGLGLVFLESSDRWAARMALKAINVDTVVEDEAHNKKRACYALSAGMSLGLVFLGKGAKSTRDVRDELEHHIVPSLESMIMRFSTDEGGTSYPETDEGLYSSEKNYSAFEWRLDISATSTPASIALALIYLRSGRQDIADKYALPETPAQLDEIRPELLQMRVLCRALVMWDSIRATKDWLDKSLPSLLQFRDRKELASASESRQLAYWSMRTGAILALGLRFAGTNNGTVRALLLEELQRHQAADLRAINYFQKLRQQALRSAIDVIINSLSMVAAGTGDAELMSVVHKALYRVDSTRYGNYMANAMSLGLLFLGGGRFSLASNNLAIAALLFAFFPRYPINSVENLTHLQAYRHLWILAIEQRLVNARDIDTNDSIKVDISLRKESDQQDIVQRDVTPCILPRMAGRATISLKSDRYLPSVLRLNRKSQAHIVTLYCKRKPAFLDFESDPDGRASFAASRREREMLLEIDAGSQIEGRNILRRSATSSEGNGRDCPHVSGLHALQNMLVGRSIRHTGAAMSYATCLSLQAVKSVILEDNIDGLGILMSCLDLTKRLAPHKVTLTDFESAIYALLTEHVSLAAASKAVADEHNSISSEHPLSGPCIVPELQARLKLAARSYLASVDA